MTLLFMTIFSLTVGIALGACWEAKLREANECKLLDWLDKL